MTSPYSATDPVFTVDGAREPDLARDCLALVVEDSTAGLRTCVAHFLATMPRRPAADDVIEYLDGRTVDFGRHLTVSLGPPGAERVVFSGSISALEVVFDEADAPHVSVYAEDVLIGLQHSRRSVTYRQASDADIVRRIASRHGLSADVDAPGPRHAEVQQVNQTDLGFLRDRADQLGADLWAAGGTIHLAARDRRQAEAVTLTMGQELISASIRADLAGQRSRVRVSGFDAGRRARIDAQADESVIGAESAGGRTGIDVLRRASDIRAEQRTLLSPLSADEAQSLADAVMRAKARSFVTVIGIAGAMARLAVGTRLTLIGVGRPFNGSGYYITRIRHVFARDDGGLRTHFSAERPTISGGP